MKKRLFVILLLILSMLVSVPALAEEKSMIGIDILGTGDFTARALGSRFDWTYGFKAIVYATSDDSITLTVMADDGVTTVWSGSTTSATSTEVLNLNTVPIPPGSTIAVSDIGSGTANIYFTAALY